MQNVLKQFGAKDINSFELKYSRSIVNLTSLYALTLILILFISSSVSYSVFSTRVGKRFNRIPPSALVQQAPKPPTAEEVRADFVEVMILVNTLLLLLSVLLSYFLARMTLYPIKKAYNLQRSFLANASHELRTPLSILQLDLENVLADPSLRHDIKGRAKSNLEEVGRMSRLVGDLLLLSRMDEARTEKTVSSVDITKLLKRVVDQFEPLAKIHTVTLTLHAEEDIAIFTHEDLLFQTITNVIKNAIIYNKPEGSVAISAIQTTTRVRITISDTGVGISKQDIKNVFNRFYRVDESRSRSTGGSGLGLSIVKSSVEYLGGKVQLESKLSKGTVVTLDFPRS